MFDDFWSLYPRKKSKGQARKTWAKLVADRVLTPTVQQYIVDHLAIRVKDDDAWINGEPQFIPHPSTWLNAEGWEDEYETLQALKPKSPKQMSDNELLKFAQSKGLRTQGKNRFELIDKLQEVT